MVHAMERPIEDHNEYLPPTQSQNTNIFSGAIPKSVTSFEFVETATKCLATSPLPPDFSRNHFFADSALVIVSCVVKVLEAMMNNVVSGFNCFTVSAMCVTSTFETKCGFMFLCYGFKLSVTMSG